MKLMSNIILLLFCAFTIIASSSAILLHPSKIKPYLLVAEASNNFTNKFFPALLDHVQTRNAIYSPLSVYAWIISIYFGAEGETQNELKSVAYLAHDGVNLQSAFRTVLDSIERGEKEAVVRTVNYIWIENKFSIAPKFNEFAELYCSVHTDVFNPNMLEESLNKINARIEDKTHGLVKNILTMDDLNGAKVLAVSSTYFTGEWAHKFYYSPSTEKTIFHVSEAEGTMVNMMHVVGKFNTGRVPGLNADYVELPFKDIEPWGRKKAITMFIIRPDSFRDLEQLVSNFEKINISELDSELQSLNVFLPQFKVESKLELTQTMNEVGIQKIFNASGELNHMVEENVTTPFDLFVQKVSLEINEVGANVNSGGTVIKPPDANDYPKFWVDAPFLAVILDNETKAKIFVARIVHPNEWLLKH
ncbi:ovalbumin-related protein X [Chelonus insularis]|uniref:ovalbumin-related protein X n=1 Tax=Chelonus insularis TaxID=460826 RepID=UPI00158D8E6E|nr:ovalbumin-related protein X [Chelonus insularis]XP_034937489.1 ovalbumin-related protein X [Chelonus insularis]